MKTPWYRVVATYAASGKTVEWKTRSEHRAKEFRDVAIKNGGAMYSSVVIIPPTR